MQEVRAESLDPREQNIEQGLLALGFRPRLARSVAEARAADLRHIEEKGDRKTLRRRTNSTKTV